MKNLAGHDKSDEFIKVELESANIPIEKIDKPTGECQYRLIGKLKNWTFTRAWNYWIASTDSENELPMSVALDMYNKIYPDEMFDHDDKKGIYGNVIRTGGHCGCPSPVEYDVRDCYHIDSQEGLNEFARVINNNEKVVNKIDIRVSGKSATGKSTIILLIKKMLNDYGFNDVYMKHMFDTDIDVEILNSKLDKIPDIIKNKTEIHLIEVPKIKYIK